MKKYVHYGHKSFDKNLFIPIINGRSFLTKPIGGLWASPIDAEYGWKNWCKDEEFCKCEDENSFTFTLTNNARVLYINDISDTDNLPELNPDISSEFKISSWVCLDFEKLKEEYDAIEIKISGRGIYFGLYGWDCDSILIMNPDIIEVI